MFSQQLYLFDKMQSTMKKAIWPTFVTQGVWSIVSSARSRTEQL